jgi:hypothetical protein
MERLGLGVFIQPGILYSQGRGTRDGGQGNSRNK